MDGLKIFSEEKLPDQKCFYRSVKDQTTSDDDKKVNSHINDEDYLINLD